MKTEIAQLIKNHTSLTVEEIVELMETPPKEEMGDYSLPCFTMASLYKKSPILIAEELKLNLEKEKNSSIDKVVAVNGYLNIYLKKEYVIRHILCHALEKNFGSSQEGQGKTICMDYSSPNIAKNFHVGHLRTTLIGNSLYKIYKKLGYHVIRINHLGDWGTQFGKLIYAYITWGTKEKVEEEGITELLRLYIIFHKEEEKNPSLIEEARGWFSKLEKENQEALAIWKWFCEISLIEFERIYQRLGIQFDSYAGESYYMDKVPAVVKELEAKKLLQESQGAHIIDLSGYQMPPCLITKKDGSSIYPSRDLAAIFYRKETYQFHKCLYVTGMEQKLHFEQVFKVVELMGYDWAKDLIHIPYGLVSLEGEKLSTRNGNIVYAEDIILEAIDRAGKLIEEKNSNLTDKENTARKVGTGAVIFHNLYNQRIKDTEFSWDKVLTFEGSSGPYIQYTYARSKSIMRKYKGEISYTGYAEILKEESCYQLLKIIGQFPEMMKEAAERYEPCIISRYAITLSQSFNIFYHNTNILKEEEENKKALMLLVYLTQKIIKEALELLGIECPEEM
jgi:arginyl-tRNA synthetase